MTTPDEVDPYAPTNGPAGERRDDGRWTLCPGCGRGISVRKVGTEWATYRHDRGRRRGWCDGARVAWADTRPNTEPRPVEASRVLPPRETPPPPYRSRNVRRLANAPVDDAFDAITAARAGVVVPRRAGTSGWEYEARVAQRVRAEYERKIAQEAPAQPIPFGPQPPPEVERARREARAAARREEEAAEQAAAVPPPADVIAQARAAARAARHRRRILGL